VGKAVIPPDEDAVHTALPHVVHERAISRLLRMARDGALRLAPADGMGGCMPDCLEHQDQLAS